MAGRQQKTDNSQPDSDPVQGGFGLKFKSPRDGNAQAQPSPTVKPQ